MSEETNLDITFKVDFKPNGDIERVQILKDGVTIGMTGEQARTLGKELSARFPPRRVSQ